MSVCILCGEAGCIAHISKPDPASEEEKLLRLWRHFQDLRARGVLPKSAYLELHADGSGCFAHNERLPSGPLLEVEHGAFMDFGGEVGSDKHYTEWQRLKGYHKETTTAGKLSAELHKWCRAKEVPMPKHIIVWGAGRNLTVWAKDRDLPFVFKGTPDDFDLAVASLRAWITS